jgi:hypothetical protein
MVHEPPCHRRDHDPVERLNDHHADDLLAVARVIGGHPDATEARAERIDDDGVDIAVETPTGSTTARVRFADAGTEQRLSPRRAFLALARQAKAERGRAESDE